MRIFQTTVLALVTTSVSASSIPNRPIIKPFPKQPSSSFPSSPPRNPHRVCTISTHHTDAGPAILATAREYNHRGTVYFSASHNYTITTVLDLSFLANIDFAILGNIKFKDDLTYWQAHAFQYAFQSTSLFWRFGGRNINIYGLGTGSIDGLGNTWWAAWATNKTVARPILFGTDSLHKATISGLKLINPPNWFNLISNSSEVIISDIDLSAISNNASIAVKNSDGWDTYHSSNIVIQNSVIHNTNDCVSFKPNSTNIIVQGLSCTRSHGISVGSLGQYQRETDIIENIYVYNISMSNATDEARIKIWPGVSPGTVGSTIGGGVGRVQNVIYEKYGNSNNDQVIALTQYYSTSNATLYALYSSAVIIKNVIFKDFVGVMSKKYNPVTGYLICSTPEVCSNITTQNIHITEPSGKNAMFTCTNVDKTNLQINCV